MNFMVVTDGFSDNKLVIRKEAVILVFTSTQEETLGKTTINLSGGTVIVSETVEEVLTMLQGE